MTLIEALRSGKKFRRKGMPIVYWVTKDAQGNNSLVCADPASMSTARVLMRVEPLIASDWELVVLPDNVIEFKPRGVK